MITGTRLHSYDEIVRLYRKLRVKRDVAKALGICTRTVVRYLEEAGQERLKLRYTKEHIAALQAGRKKAGYSAETREKLSKVQRGDKHWNWRGGKKRVNCSFCGRFTYRLACVIKRNKQVVCKRKECYAKFTRCKLGGKNHWNWQGGLTLVNKTVREMDEYKEWRTAVYERDGYTCRICDSGGDLVAHHKTSLGNLLRTHKITNAEQARECAELWDVQNGITLCRGCHAGTESYMRGCRNVS